MKKIIICIVLCFVVLSTISSFLVTDSKAIDSHYETNRKEDMTYDPTLFPLPSWSLWKITGTIEGGKRGLFSIHFTAIDMEFYKYRTGETWSFGNENSRTFKGFFVGTVTPTYIDVVGYFLI